MRFLIARRELTRSAKLFWKFLKTNFAKMKSIGLQSTNFVSDSLCSDVDPPGDVQRNEENIKHEHHVTDIEQQLEKSYRERE